MEPKTGPGVTFVFYNHDGRRWKGKYVARDMDHAQRVAESYAHMMGYHDIQVLPSVTSGPPEDLPSGDNRRLAYSCEKDEDSDGS